MPVQHKSTHKNAVRSRQMIKKAFAEMLNEKENEDLKLDIIEDKIFVFIVRASWYTAFFHCSAYVGFGSALNQFLGLKHFPEKSGDNAFMHNEIIFRYHVLSCGLNIFFWYDNLSLN